LGPGGIVLSGTSTFSGGVLLADGVLSVNSSSTATNGPLGTGMLTISNATVLSTGGTNARTISNAVSVVGNYSLGSGTGNATLTMAGPMDLNGGTRVISIVNTNGGGDIISGVISNGALTVGAGAGTLVLSGNNTYEGDTTLNNTAKLSVGSDANLGVGTNVIINQNGELTISGNVTSSKRITLIGSAQSIIINSGKTCVFNGVVGGSGQTPNKNGPGTLILNAANEFADMSILLVKDGTLKLGNAAALNNITLKFNPAGSYLDNSSGAAMTATGIQGLEMTSGFTFNGTDDLDLSAMPSAFVQTPNTTRTLNIAAKTLTIGGILSTGTDSAGTARLSGALDKRGMGTLVIKGPSDYTNGTAVTAGTLRLGANDALPPGGAVVLAGGTLDMGAYACSPSSLNVSTNSALVLGTGQLSFTSQTNTWTARLTLIGDLKRFTLHFAPALTATQLGQIDYGGGKFYQTSDGYLHNYPKGSIIRVQ
jgi:autotransporter-associated beta strand protein